MLRCIEVTRCDGVTRCGDVTRCVDVAGCVEVARCDGVARCVEVVRCVRWQGVSSDKVCHVTGRVEVARLSLQAEAVIACRGFSRKNKLRDRELNPGLPRDRRKY